MSWRPEDLRKGVGETRSKTEQNRLMAADASEAADAALQNATEVQEVSGPEMASALLRRAAGCSCSNRLSFRR